MPISVYIIGHIMKVQESRRSRASSKRWNHCWNGIPPSVIDASGQAETQMADSYLRGEILPYQLWSLTKGVEEYERCDGSKETLREQTHFSNSLCDGTTWTLRIETSFVPSDHLRYLIQKFNRLELNLPRTMRDRALSHSAERHVHRGCWVL